VDNAKPQVILLVYLYPPHREIGSMRPFRFRKYLERMGYRCHVITATPQPQLSPGVTFIEDELGKVWEGEGGPLGLRGYVELLLRQLVFPGHVGFVWSRKAAAEARRIVAANPGARFVVFSSYPPLGSLLAGMFARGKRTPWIMDFRDPLAALVHGGVTWYQMRGNQWAEKRIFRQASAIIANTAPAAEVWRERYPGARAKLHVIYNGYDPEESPRARPVPPRDHKLIVHAGTLYGGRNPNALIESLARLRSQGVAEALRAKVLLLGSTLAEANWALYEQAQREGWLELRATVPRPEAQRIVEEADALLIVQPHTTVQVPGKLFEYVCIGRPVVAIVPPASPIEEIITKAAVPSTFLYPGDPPAVADEKVLQFLRLPNTPAPINEWFREHFNAEAQTQALAHIIDRVASDS
jgi:glycosyltransferase involved in cell wall biosynthesis